MEGAGATGQSLGSGISRPGEGQKGGWEGTGPPKVPGGAASGPVTHVFPNEAPSNQTKPFPPSSIPAWTAVPLLGRADKGAACLPGRSSLPFARHSAWGRRHEGPARLPLAAAGSPTMQAPDPSAQDG